MTDRLAFALLLFLALPLLSACGTNTPKEEKECSILLPMPEVAAANDPGNSLFMEALEGYIRSKEGPAYSRYEFTRIDLDGDGRREGLALITSPHRHWCSANGCPLAIFKAHDDGFSLIAETSPVRGPLTISIKKTNGWRDIIARVSGREYLESKTVALRYDGQTYPRHPAFEPAYNENPAGTIIFP